MSEHNHDQSVGLPQAKLASSTAGLRAARLVSAGVIMLGLVMGGLAFLHWGPSPVIIEWTTANELNSAGYNIVRGENPDTINTLINEQIIPPGSDPVKGSKYRYEDSSVQAGTTYYYSLQEVDFEGNLSEYGPIIATAKRGGRLELTLAVVLVLAGIIGLCLPSIIKRIS